jgi:hypothetical protein
MAILDTQKVDLLFKKVGFGVAKTDWSNAKSASNETIASPLLVPGTSIWQQSYSIPSSIPGANTSVVTLYNDSLSSTVECVADITAGNIGSPSQYQTYKTNLTDWIPPSFGSTYQVKVYAAAPGNTNPQSYTQLFADDAGVNWYFDYQSGVLNFADYAVPTVEVGKHIYISGARYTGVKGISTFSNLTVSGNVVAGNVSVSGYIYGNLAGSLSGNISGNVAGNVTGNLIGNVLTSAQPYITSLGTLTSLAVSGNINVGNVITTGSNYGNISADTISPYTTNVVAFTNQTAVKLPTGDNSARPTGVAGYFRYNTSIASVEYYNGSGWIPFNNQITNQRISPDGVNNSFTLNQTSTAEGLLVSINGTMQQPGISYTVSGTTITFAEIPNISDIVDVRYIASAGTTTLDYQLVDTGNITVGTSNVIVDSFNPAIFRSAKYIVTSSNGVDASMLEAQLVQNAGVAVINTSANVNTGANSLTFYANVYNGLVNFIVSGTTVSNQLRIQRTYFNV